MSRRSFTPSLVLIARVLKRHRKRSSYLFMIWWGLIRSPRRASSDSLPPALVLSMGFNHRDLRQIAGLYRGLTRERNAAIALACCIDIVHTLQRHGKSRRFK